MRKILLALTTLTFSAGAALAWTSSASKPNNAEGDNTVAAVVQSTDGRGKMEFLCGEGMIHLIFYPGDGVQMNYHGALYVNDAQIPTSAADSADRDYVWADDQTAIKSAAAAFMRASDPVKVVYSSQTQPDVEYIFPSEGATKALKPTLASSLCG